MRTPRQAGVGGLFLFLKMLLDIEPVFILFSVIGEIMLADRRASTKNSPITIAPADWHYGTLSKDA